MFLYISTKIRKEKKLNCSQRFELCQNDLKDFKLQNTLKLNTH